MKDEPIPTDHSPRAAHMASAFDGMMLQGEQGGFQQPQRLSTRCIRNA